MIQIIVQLFVQAEAHMFALFAQSPRNITGNVEMWFNANHTVREEPVRFKFSQSETLDCIGKQILQLKVSAFMFFIQMRLKCFIVYVCYGM